MTTHTISAPTSAEAARVVADMPSFGLAQPTEIDLTIAGDPHGICACGDVLDRKTKKKAKGRK